MTQMTFGQNTIQKYSRHPTRSDLRAIVIWVIDIWQTVVAPNNSWSLAQLQVKNQRTQSWTSFVL
jgi:hypothetical protein